MHRAPGDKLQGSFFILGHPSYALENAPDSYARRLLLSAVRSPFWRGRFLFGQTGDLRRPATYRGLSEEVHED